MRGTKVLSAILTICIGISLTACGAAATANSVTANAAQSENAGASGQGTGTAAENADPFVLVQEKQEWRATADSDWENEDTATDTYYNFSISKDGWISCEWEYSGPVAIEAGTDPLAAPTPAPILATPGATAAPGTSTGSFTPQIYTDIPCSYMDKGLSWFDYFDDDVNIEYDANGKISKLSDKEGNIIPHSKCGWVDADTEEYERDDENNVIKINCYRNGELSAYWTITYNEQGVPAQAILYRSDVERDIGRLTFTFMKQSEIFGS